MKVYQILNEDGRIVKGVNTTVDVGVGQIPIEAAKFGSKVDKDGRPPTLSSKVKGKSTNVLFNLGLTEGFSPVTWIKNALSSDPQFKAWKRMYSQDPQKAKRTFGKKHVEFLAQLQGESIEEKWSAKYKRSINCSNPKGFSQKAHCAGRNKKESVNEWVCGKCYAEPCICINENFADGKVKGKSRPGRVKRSGASCKGSVTQLRKRAKNASGERAKMYHWCANMKSGKK